MDSYSIQTSEFADFQTYVLKDKDNGLSLTILPEIGSQILSLYSNKRQVEFIKGPGKIGDKTTGYGFPILMPPNRIKGGKFTYGDRDYNFEINENGRNNHIHGLVHNKPWTVKDIGADKSKGAWIQTVINSCNHQDILEQFPHKFELFMTYILNGECLEIEVSCVNNDEVSMPFGIGFHPYFNAPLSKSSTKEACKVSVPANKIWELDECIPTGTLISLDDNKKDLRKPSIFNTFLIDDIYTDLNYKDNDSTCTYFDYEGKIGIEFTADKQFKHWVIFTGKSTNDKFICLEPYTWVTNAPNMNLDQSLTGFRSLEPGEIFQGKMKIAII